jgi:two-component system sensor histidine kinase ChvG
MSLRAKLLLLSLLTLVLPWAGWRYAQQMETTLRHGQEESLITTADVLSRVVASEPESLYRVPEFASEFDPANGDYFAPLLPTTPLIDGFADEWPSPSRPIAGLAATPANDGNPQVPLVKLGVFARHMHIYIEVEQRPLRYEIPAVHEDLPSIPADRVIVLTRDEFSHERAWSISAVAPGPLLIRNCDVGAPWSVTSDDAVPINGVWRETSKGYAIELRGPINLFGTWIGITAVDANNNVVARTPDLGRLHTGSEALKARLEQYAPDGVRVSVVDSHGWLLARAGSIRMEAAPTESGLEQDQDGFARSIYRRLLSRGETPPRAFGLPYGMWGDPIDTARQGRALATWAEQAAGEPTLIRAAVPIRVGGETAGALLVEEGGEQLVLVRELALNRLLNLTLVAVIVSIAVTLLFAARLSQRIRRLSRAAAEAVGPDGRIDINIPDTQARDELGTLARSYTAVLSRLKEYNSYLQTLGSKLSHELRTPLTIVSSSLDNLTSETELPPTSQNYLDRARTGTSRMQAILSAMSEATRVEQSIEQTERSRFDLRELVASLGQAYQQTFADHRIEVQVPTDPCWIDGSPELIAQLTDKLMDNAVDFAPADGLIQIALESIDSKHRLKIANQGPRLPQQLDGRLFESLVSGRSGSDGRPHLGLGLYIVRLIAQFHRGSVAAENLTDGSGVEFAIELPRAS